MTSWYEQYDGDLSCCIQPVCSTPVLRRRFSPYCRIVDVTPQTPQVYFRVDSSLSSGVTLTFNYSRVYLELRRKGQETLIATYNAWRRDENGAIGFYFDDAFFEQCDGYYVGDVYIDCKYCFSVQLRLPPCEAAVVGCYVQPAMETCGREVCSLIDPVGLGIVGGWMCDIAPATNCGDIAPYFTLSDSGASVVSCPIPSVCNFPSIPCGLTPVG